MMTIGIPDPRMNPLAKKRLTKWQKYLRTVSFWKRCVNSHVPFKSLPKRDQRDWIKLVNEDYA